MSLAAASAVTSMHALRREVEAAGGRTGTRAPLSDVVICRARSGRVVAEYRFADGFRVFAKRFSTRGEAVAAYRDLQALRTAGFDATSTRQVVEPLALLVDQPVVVLGAAAGDRLAPLLADGLDHTSGLRLAGEWLATLHAAPVRVGPQLEPAVVVERVIRRAVRAMALMPEMSRLVCRIMDELGERSHDEGSGRRSQAHGRFHAAHVFVADGTVTVIDLDRAGVAEPALDVGEFLHRLRLPRLRRRRGERAAQRALASFTDGYASVAGDLPPRVGYYWSCATAAALTRLIEVGHPRLERRVEQLVAEFTEVRQMPSTMLGGGP